jgi:hypothetical protein
MTRRAPKPEPPKLPELKKGTLLVLKVPPYYTKSYLYEVTSAGDKKISASLYHSPTVKKHWSKEELLAMFNQQIVRIANDEDLKSLTTASAPSDADD